MATEAKILELEAKIAQLESQLARAERNEFHPDPSAPTFIAPDEAVPLFQAAQAR